MADDKDNSMSFQVKEESTGGRPTMHSPRRRKRGDGNQANLRLQAEERKGYVRRWVVEEPGRVQQLNERNDYEFVKDEDGKPVRVVSGRDGRGQEQYSYLMEIPEEFYAEDQKEKQVPDPHKMAEARAGKGEYIPGGGDSALR